MFLSYLCYLPEMAVGLRDMLANFSPSLEVKDECVWTGNGTYSITKDVTLRLYEEYNIGSEQASMNWQSIWKGLCEPRVAMTLWFTLIRRLATRELLFERDLIPIGQSLCPWCKRAMESVEHVLFLCHKIAEVWNKVLCWWNVSFYFKDTIVEIYQDWWAHQSNGKVGRVWKSSLCYGIYYIWLHRNNAIFRGEALSVDRIVIQIKLGVWRWTKCWWKDLVISSGVFLNTSSLKDYL